jgi:hypothetical protein
MPTAEKAFVAVSPVEMTPEAGAVACVADEKFGVVLEEEEEPAGDVGLESSARSAVEVVWARSEGVRTAERSKR